MSGEPCYSIVRKPKDFETANEITLKRRIEGDNLEKCQAAIEELLQNLLDGEKFPTNLMMPVINRYQMNKFAKGQVGIRDKRIKKLLYILWECLPKRGPDGKFLDRMVMVCGAFDKDLKHPNQYVCGSVLRTLGKTSEPEVIRELVHSIEKCLEWSHAYQRKNAVLAIARIYKNFPDLNPSAPKLIADYLMKETDDECKRAALQALLEIDPEEAKPYLHSSNVQDIHCMNASLQLLFVELIQRLFRKGSEEAKDYVTILTSLIKQSSSPSVRYQAASTLMKFTREPEPIKIVAACFIDICAKDSDNNVKLIALSSLINLRRINAAERVLRNSIMDILFILQSATDFELQEKILKLTIDLLSPLNVGGVVTALRQEIQKSSKDPERVKYRRLLVDTVHQVCERFSSAIVEFEMLDTLFDLLVSNTVGDRTSSRLILLFKVFMTNNPSYQGEVVKKIQDCFNLAKDNQSTHRGLIQLLGDFSETKEQIERSYRVIKESLGELPIVATELGKQAQKDEETGDEGSQTKNSTANGDVDMISKGMSRLVTADGSYAAQSAINYQTPIDVNEEHPPLRSYYLKNKFDTASDLCYALSKMACRYQQVGASKSEYNKMMARFIFLLGSILHLGYANLVDNEGNTIHINNEHAEYLMFGLNILQQLANKEDEDKTILIKKFLTQDMRSQLKLAVKSQEKDAFASDMFKKKKRISRFDDPISISMLESRDEDFDLEHDDDDNIDTAARFMPNMFNEIPLTGTIDPIYAYCEFDVNEYDVGIKVHLENRARVTLENVTLELAARGENSSNYIDRPSTIVLGPRAKTCITSNIKVVSAENRRLFGSITFDAPGAKEQVIMLNDISVNITDYIKPSSISFEEFREIWRDSEWENKVTVKTELTNLKDYLMKLIAATNTRCVTTEKGLSGDVSFLTANLFARSSLGEEALVNVSIEKEFPTSVVSGSVKIRSRSQGMALSLGEKINSTPSGAKAPATQKENGNSNTNHNNSKPCPKL